VHPTPDFAHREWDATQDQTLVEHVMPEQVGLGCVWLVPADLRDLALPVAVGAKRGDQVPAHGGTAGLGNAEESSWCPGKENN
jgi:hypothetical protein